jgi:hypothetical protein
MDKKNVGAQFRFKKNDHIGEAEAEADEEYLLSCFIDNGDLDTLRDCSAAQRILVGRTGAGKSALLKMLQQNEQNVISLPPEQLALSYLSNSGVIRFFEEAGANLDIFYQLLWRHVLAVELLKRRYKITNDASQKSFLQWLGQLISLDKAKQQAIEYLRTWGENFWNETEYRVKDVTAKLETELRASISTPSIVSKLEAGASKKLSEEERQEVIQRGAHVVNKVQIKALSDVLKLLSEEVFNDSQERYYITIDDLDTKWADDALKFKLIRALIETIKHFRQIKSVKVIVSIRVDLLQRVIEATRDSGFQSEKYESLFLKIHWHAVDICRMVDLRVGHLVKQRYTSHPIGINDLFPAQVSKVPFRDFLTQRTFLRPRDAILFANECISRAADRGQISSQIVLDAEGAYSQKRINSLAEEWGGIYPLVSNYLSVFSGKRPTLNFSEFIKSEVETWAFATLLNHNESTDPVAIAANMCFLADKTNYQDFLKTLIKAMYTVGAVGVKINATTTEQWSYYSDQPLVESALMASSVVKLHPLFWRAVGINENLR